jgi:hypothetical protein
MEQQLNWKGKLADKIPVGLAREIDIFEQQIELRKQGKIDEKVFAETRLRRGIYGQRYDNGQRHDGKRIQRTGNLLGRAGYDADQNSLWWSHARTIGSVS